MSTSRFYMCTHVQTQHEYVYIYIRHTHTHTMSGIIDTGEKCLPNFLCANILMTCLL